MVQISAGNHIDLIVDGRECGKVCEINLLVRVRNFSGQVVLALEEDLIELDELGLYIWTRLDGRTSVRDLAELVSTEYQVPTKKATSDVAEFLEGLASRNFVVSVES